MIHQACIAEKYYTKISYYCLLRDSSILPSEELIFCRPSMQKESTLKTLAALIADHFRDLLC